MEALCEMKLLQFRGGGTLLFTLKFVAKIKLVTLFSYTDLSDG